MEFEFLNQAKKRTTRRRWSWRRFWLAFSLGGLLFIGTMALMKAMRASVDGGVPDPVIGGEPLETYVPPRQEATLDVLRERPSDRPVPKAVNEFLRAEQSLSTQRLQSLEDREVAVQAIDFTSRCLPQWDFRQLDKREVIWFYHYQACVSDGGNPLTVFGAVDGVGHSLFQHPPMNDDPMALLDSQYAGLKWVALDKPALALIVGSNGPWPTCGAVIDVFLVNDVSGPRFWRFRDGSFPEGPRCSAQLIDFRDLTGDGYRDLCGFRLEGEPGNETPHGRVYPFDTTLHTFQSDPVAVEGLALEQLRADFQGVLSGETLPHPYVLGAPETEPIFDGKEEADADVNQEVSR